MINKTFMVDAHCTTAILDHYSKEIKKLLSSNDCLSDINNTVIVAQISCMPDGSHVTFYLVNEEHYKSWKTSVNSDRYVEIIIMYSFLKI